MPTYPLDLVLDEINQVIQSRTPLIKITRMDDEAIRQWEEQWRHASPELRENRQKPNGGWNWKELYRVFGKNKRYKPQLSIDFAIWYENQLCGLVLGKTDKNNAYVEIAYIEGSPIKEHPLKGRVLNITLTIIERYAIILEIPELRLIEPVENLIEHYHNLGFAFFSPKNGKSYCSKLVV